MATLPSTSLYPATVGVYPSGALTIAGTVPLLEIRTSSSSSPTGG